MNMMMPNIDNRRNKSLMKTAPGEKEVIDLVDYLLTSCFVTGRSFPLDGGRHLR